MAESAAYGALLQRCVTTQQESGHEGIIKTATCVTRAWRTGRCPRKKWESAGKPGSVVGNHSSGMHVAVHLVRPTRERARAVRRRTERAPSGPFPYLALLRAGFAVPRLLPSARCALTAPFHPCQRQANLSLRRFAFCCTFRGLAPPRCYLAPCPVEPGLSSRSRPARGCLADSRDHDRAGPRQAQARSGESAPRWRTASARS